MAKILNKQYLFLKKFPSEYKKGVPIIYFLILVIGVLLTLVYAFVPGFVTCSGLFGQQFCTPTGIFVALSASLPGYLIVGNFLGFVQNLPLWFSFLSVVVISGIFYFFIGYFIDIYLKKKLKSESSLEITIIVIFVLLLGFLFFLLRKS